MLPNSQILTYSHKLLNRLVNFYSKSGGITCSLTHFSTLFDDNDDSNDSASKTGRNARGRGQSGSIGRGGKSKHIGDDIKLGATKKSPPPKIPEIVSKSAPTVVESKHEAHEMLKSNDKLIMSEDTDEDEVLDDEFLKQDLDEHKVLAPGQYDELFQKFRSASDEKRKRQFIRKEVDIDAYLSENQASGDEKFLDEKQMEERLEKMRQELEKADEGDSEDSEDEEEDDHSLFKPDDEIVEKEKEQSGDEEEEEEINPLQSLSDEIQDIETKYDALKVKMSYLKLSLNRLAQYEHVDEVKEIRDLVISSKERKRMRMIEIKMKNQVASDDDKRCLESFNSRLNRENDKYKLKKKHIDKIVYRRLSQLTPSKCIKIASKYAMLSDLISQDSTQAAFERRQSYYKRRQDLSEVLHKDHDSDDGYEDNLEVDEDEDEDDDTFYTSSHKFTSEEINVDFSMPKGRLKTVYDALKLSVSGLVVDKDAEFAFDDDYKDHVLNEAEEDDAGPGDIKHELKTTYDNVTDVTDRAEACLMIYNDERGGKIFEEILRQKDNDDDDDDDEDGSLQGYDDDEDSDEDEDSEDEDSDDEDSDDEDEEQARSGEEDEDSELEEDDAAADEEGVETSSLDGGDAGVFDMKEDGLDVGDYLLTDDDIKFLKKMKAEERNRFMCVLRRKIRRKETIFSSRVAVESMPAELKLMSEELVELYEKVGQAIPSNELATVDDEEADDDDDDDDDAPRYKQYDLEKRYKFVMDHIDGKCQAIRLAVRNNALKNKNVSYFNTSSYETNRPKLPMEEVDRLSVLENEDEDDRVLRIFQESLADTKKLAKDEEDANRAGDDAYLKEKVKLMKRSATVIEYLTAKKELKRTKAELRRDGLEVIGTLSGENSSVVDRKWNIEPEIDVSKQADDLADDLHNLQMNMIGLFINDDEALTKTQGIFKRLKECKDASAELSKISSEYELNDKAMQMIGIMSGVAVAEMMKKKTKKISTKDDIVGNVEKDRAKLSEEDEQEMSDYSHLHIKNAEHGDEITEDDVAILKKKLKFDDDKMMRIINQVERSLEPNYKVLEHPPMHHLREFVRKIDEYGRSLGVGRRKTATAQVWIWRGTGQVRVNHKSVADYFPEMLYRDAVLSPFQVTRTSGQFDMYVKVNGGGKSGQSQAIRHGLARALVAWEPRLYPSLRGSQMYYRDIRVKERKKPGRKKARKQFQWIKR